MHLHQFPLFAGHALRHAVFGRHGGVSPAPYDSLNMSISTGDSPENARANRQLAYTALGIENAQIATLWLVHGVNVVAVNDAPCHSDTHGDALITNNPQIALFLRFADCVPIFFYDTRQHAVGLAHAGWRGTVDGVQLATLRAMQTAYGTDAADVLVAIGPSISPQVYAVGQEVVQAVEKSYGTTTGLINWRGEQAFFDLWEANARPLRTAGVRQIEICGVCTYLRHDLYFSHRADGPVTGRFGAIVQLLPRQ